MLTPEQTAYHDMIVDRSERARLPNVVSLADDTHVFHFEDQKDWRDGLLLFVNRNGNHFRLWRSRPGEKWKHLKTWNGLFDHQRWMGTALKDENPERLIALCGAGPQGMNNFEELTLFPKNVIQRRKLCFRDKIVPVRFVSPDAFRLQWEDGTESTIFTGKPWASREASAWCREMYERSPVRGSVQVDQQEERELEVALEGSDMWGMF